MDKTPTFKNRLETLKQALKGFQDALNINLSGKDPIEVDAIKSGHAQKFELTVELLWKAIKVGGRAKKIPIEIQQIGRRKLRMINNSQDRNDFKNISFKSS